MILVSYQSSMVLTAPCSQLDTLHQNIWGFTKIRDTFLGVPIIRTIVYWGLLGFPLFWETTISSHEDLILIMPAGGGRRFDVRGERFFVKEGQQSTSFSGNPK